MTAETQGLTALEAERHHDGTYTVYAVWSGDGTEPPGSAIFGAKDIPEVLAELMIDTLPAYAKGFQPQPIERGET